MLVILDKLNFYLYKFWILLKPRRKLGLVSFVILASLVAMVLVVGTNTVHAGIGEDIGNLLIGWIFDIAGLFIKLTFFILKFVIEVAAYNSFIDSSAVIVGWIMVRDVTNMFFVVVLLLISFGTILGLEQYEYKKLLVKLIMAAIVVNFSRIICGIIIDVAQVVMITFVNGIAATASGNLVNMFGIGKIFQLTGSATGVAQKGSTFLAAIAAITFSAIMMMTMLTFLFLLMARMMTLWILIVLSPFAFVLNVLPQTQKYAGQWWQEFGGNVVAGPIIAFFLWLSFVTVGAGEANREIAAGSSQPLVQSTDPQETSTGLTEIMTWAQMANFAIAIGMLLTGAKVAQQLGAAGGAMMGKAGDFGKKVAMTASGITAARWAGKQALAGGKKLGKGALKVGDFGLSKVGLSTEDWKRRGRNIKSSVLASYYDKQALKTRKASEIAKSLAVDEKGEYLNKGASGWLKRQVARTRLQFGGYGSFNEEYSKDLETNVKNREELIEHLASISSMEAGQAKQRSAEELKFNKETGGGIKAGKEARMDERRLEINQAIAAGGKVDAALANMGLNSTEIAQAKADYTRLGKANEGKAKAKITGEYTGAAQGKKEAEAMAKYMGGKGSGQEEEALALKAETKLIEDKLTSDRELKELQAIKELLMGKGKDEQKAISLVKAEIENMKEDYEMIKAESIAEGRAENYRKNDDDLRANQVVSEHRAKVAKVDSERVNSMSWEDKTFALQTMPTRIGSLEGKIASAEQAGNLAEAKRLAEIRNKTLRRSVALQAALKESGREGSELAAGQSLKAVGWDEVIDDDNRMRAEVSAIVGRHIKNNAELEDAVEEIYDAYGGLEKAQGALTLLSNANKAAAMKGVGSAMGMFGQRTDGNGRLEMFFGQPDPTQKGVIKTAQVNKGAGAYPTKEAELDYRKWTSAAGYAKIKIDATGSSQIAGFDPERAEQLAAIFAGKNELFMSQMQNYFFNSLNGAEVNAQNTSEYRTLLNKISEVLKDEKARAKFEERAAGLLEKLNEQHLPPLEP